MILTYLDSSIAKVFSEKRPIFVLFYFNIIKIIFLIFAIIREKPGFKSKQKGQTLGLSFFHEKLNSQKIFEIVILFARVLPLVKISKTWDYILGSKGPNTSQKRLFYGC